MADELFGEQKEPLSLADLMPPVEEQPKAVPEASLRNRASTISLLSDPAKINENYEGMMAEGRAGGDALTKQLEQAVLRQDGSVDMKNLLTMMGDPKLPMEHKKILIHTYAKNGYLPDVNSILRARSLESGSSGEGVDNEKARISTADAIREMQQNAEEVQGMVNAFVASSGGGESTLGDLSDIVGAALTPFGTNIITGRVAANAEDKGSLWNIIKKGALPGETIKGMRERFQSMPPEQRTAYVRNLATALSGHGGIIFPGSNSYAQVEMMRAITEDGRYENTDRFLDDASTLLDIIGLGSMVRGLKSGKVINKASKGIPSPAEVRAMSNLPAEVVHKADWELVDDTSKALVPKGKNVVPHAYDVTPKPIQIGGPRALPAPKSKAQEILDIRDKAERVEKNAHMGVENPVSPINVMSQTNPEKARAAINIIDKADDEASLALAGTKRDEALVKQVVPQVLTETEKVTAKVVDPFRTTAPVDEMLMEAVRSAGSSRYTAAERAAARAKFTTDFTQAQGLTVQDGMGGFKISENGKFFEMSSVYGTNEGAFSNARQAVEQAKFALRNYGIRDDEIELLAKQGNDYVPVKLKDVGEKEGSYLVRLKTDQEFGDLDVGKMESLDVKRNWLDRLSALVPNKGKASAARYLMDPASMLHPTLTNSIGAAVDRASYIDKRFIELTTNYSDIASKLPKDRQIKLNDFLVKSDEQGIPFSRSQMFADGFTPKEIEAAEHWKNIWDNHYYFENDDLIRTLNRDGYQMYVGPNGTQLFAKAVGPSADIGKIAIGPNKTVGRIFDPVTGNAEYATRTDTEMLYAAGGTYAQLRRPIDINGELVSHVIVRNTPNEYLRKFRDTDAVLNYRPMHFTRYYKSAKFVDEIGANGIPRAIAVGPDTPYAKAYVERMQANNPDKQYRYRDDDRGVVRGSDDWFDIESAGGRLAQRHRGQTLGTTVGMQTLGEGNFVLDPANSAVRAAGSLSSRIAMRDVLETAKKRAVEQYGHMFPEGRFPSSLDQIGEKGNFTSKELADARTVVGHIQYMENGWHDTADAVYKQFINYMANELGERGFGKAERAVRSVEDINIAGSVKGAVFQSYIVMSNFVRQWIVQSNNAIRTLGYNPTHVVSGGIAKDVATFLSDMGKANKSDFTTFAMDSGMLAGLDKSNLVRGSLSAMTEYRNGLTHALHRAFVQIPRQIGFDAGEGLNLISYMSAVYDKYKRAGKDVLDKTVREEMYGQVRALTGEMNRAGDMPYNAGAMSAMTQFLQVPHKSYLMYTNRKLDGNTKLRMLATDAILWGTPLAAISQMFGGDVLPDDPDSRYLATEGVQAYLYNQIFKSVSEGEQEDLDFSSLNPYGLDGWGKLYFAMREGKGFGDLTMVAPAYAIFNTESGRIPLAIKEMGRYFSGDQVEGLPPATMATVLDRVARISSGYSSYAVAHAALESGKWKSNAGDELPGDVTPELAIAKSLGFDRISTRELYKLSNEIYRNKKDFEDAVMKDYKETYRILTQAMNKTKEEREIDIAATNYLLNKWKGNDEAFRIIMRQQKKDLLGKDSMLLRQIIRNSGVPDIGATRDQIKRAPIEESAKDILLQRFNDDVIQ